MPKLIINIMANVWPMIIIFLTIIASIRITYIITKKIKFSLYKEILMLIFVVYILCLFYVVTFQDVSWSTSNFIPFKELFRYSIGSPMFMRNALGNMLIFLPYGFFVAYFLKLDKAYISLILTLIASSTIEITQLIIGRVFDIDDIFLNIWGGLLGYALYKSIDALKDHLPSMLKKDLVYNIIMLVLTIIAVIYFMVIVSLGA